MKYLIISVLAFFTTTNLCAQTEIKNELTDEYVRIKNTKVFLIPVPGFRITPTNAANSYANPETGASYGVLQFDKPYQSIKDYLSDAYLTKKGYKIIKIIDYKINDLTACWYELEESEFFGKIMYKNILIVGNENEYAMLEAYYSKEDESDSAAKIKKSIFGIYYDVDSKYIEKTK